MTVIQSAIKLRVQDSTTFVIGQMDKDIYQAFKKSLGFEDEKAMWKARQFQKKAPGKAKWVKNWNGFQTTVCYNKDKCRCSIKKAGIHFPTGLLGKAREFFGDCSLAYELIDDRSPKITLSTPYAMSPKFEVRDYQTPIINDACNQQRGIIKLSTGGGKTSIASGIISQLGGSPVVFYVTSRDLLKQAKDELTKFITCNGQPLEVGVVGGGRCDIKDITVMTVQTAVKSLGFKFSKYDDEDVVTEKEKLNEQQKKEVVDLIQSSRVIIADECQHWSAKSCQIISDNSLSARYRYGLSATPFRDEGDDMLIDACFGRCIADINASFLIDRGYLVPPTIYFVHHRTPNMEGAYATIYKEGIVENQERNLMISNVARKMADSGRNVLVLVKIIEHGECLEAMTPDSFFLNGSHSAAVRSDWLEKMRRREAPITIATSIFDEGIDVKPLDGLVLAGSGKSQTRALQRIGRVIRTFEDAASSFVKKDAFVVDFHDNMKYMLSHSRKRRRIYETEPRFIIKDWK